MQEIEELLVKGEKIPGILKVNDKPLSLPDSWSEPKLTSIQRPWIKGPTHEEIKIGNTDEETKH